MLKLYDKNTFNFAFVVIKKIMKNRKIVILNEYTKAIIVTYTFLHISVPLTKICFPLSSVKF